MPPKLPMQSAALLLANFKQDFNGFLLDHFDIKPAAKASPAPVVSTTGIFLAGHLSISFFVSRIDPLSPSVTTSKGMPYSIKKFMPFLKSRPVNISTSFSFKNNISVLESTGSSLSMPYVESNAPGAKDNVLACLAAA